MAKPLIEVIGEEKAKEIVANVKQELRPHLEYLIRNIDVELGVSPPALRLNNEVVYVRDPRTLDLFVERLLVRSGYVFKHGIVGEDLGTLVFMLTMVSQKIFSVKGLEELTWEGEGVKYFIEATDGIIAPIHGFIFQYGEELIASDVVYAAVTKQITDENGVVKKEVRTIEPILVYSIFREGIIVDRNYVPPLAEKEPLVFNISGRPVRVEAKSIGKSMLQTLMTKETLKRFISSEDAKPFHELFSMVKSRLMRYVSFQWDPRLYDVVSCYILGTYFYDLFSAYPRIQYAGPYGSGKTRAMLTTVYMSRHGYAILSPTEASNYRSIEAYGPTIGIDEKTFTKEFETLVAAGYKRSGKVPRVSKAAKEKFILELFEVYAPVVFSTVEELGENLKQKTIIITMEITEDPNPEHRDPEPWDLEDVREELYLARLTRTWEVYEAMRFLKIPELKGRAFELWFPLLVMAKLVGEDVYRNVLSYALEDVGKRFEELYAEEKKILEAIERLFYNKIRELEVHETLVKTEITENFTVEFQAKDVHEALRQIMVDENKELDERAFMKKWNTVKIGRLLHRRFKLENPRDSSGKRRIYSISLKKFAEFCKTFGYLPGNVLTLLTDLTLFPETPESRTPSEKPSETIKTPSEPTSEKPQRFPEKVSEVSDLSVKKAILETLSTREAASGLRDTQIYEILARLQKHGKLKTTINYDTVKKTLEELEAEGKVQEENGLWRLHCKTV